jgi:hypothetical protein
MPLVDIDRAQEWTRHHRFVQVVPSLLVSHASKHTIAQCLGGFRKLIMVDLSGKEKLAVRMDDGTAELANKLRILGVASQSHSCHILPSLIRRFHASLALVSTAS